MNRLMEELEEEEDFEAFQMRTKNEEDRAEIAEFEFEQAQREANGEGDIDDFERHSDDGTMRRP